jgi:hypothetical protein
MDHDQSRSAYPQAGEPRREARVAEAAAGSPDRADLVTLPWAPRGVGRETRAVRTGLELNPGSAATWGLMAAPRAEWQGHPPSVATGSRSTSG